MSQGGVERHYTTRELAEQLRCHPETIRRHAASGDLRSVRVGAERRYAESAVQEWLHDHDDETNA